MKAKLLKNYFILVVCLTPLVLFSQNNSEILTIHENFDKDPKWEGVNNRVECEDCPKVNQDFGWAPTNHNLSGKGEIGGTIWRSTTPGLG